MDCVRRVNVNLLFLLLLFYNYNVFKFTPIFLYLYINHEHSTDRHYNSNSSPNKRVSSGRCTAIAMPWALERNGSLIPLVPVEGEREAEGLRWVSLRNGDKRSHTHTHTHTHTRTSDT